MDPPTGPLRIYREDPAESEPGRRGTDPAEARRLAAQELLRPIAVRPGHRELEPFSRGWFEELEFKRYAPHGAWLRKVLEFTRHPGESLLMVGAGVGTDALQYQRHGTDVTVCVTPADRPELVRRNFALRGLAVRLVHAGAEPALPFERGAFDLAYLNLLYAPPADAAAMADELYRVLKPGGKAFVLAPARFDAGFWQDILVPFRRWYRPRVELTDAPRYTARNLRRAFARFSEHRVGKRHLRRSELPHLWRWAPVSALARVMGRVLVLRAFKPVAAALESVAVDPAA
jgi:SAM-dependent methyltransferase